MFASIDMQGLRVLHVHPSQDVLWDLVYLECADVTVVRVDNTDQPHFLGTLTDLELKMLYRNVTGGEVALLDSLTIRQALANVIGKMPPLKVNPIELARQCEIAAPEVDEGRATFKYSKGARTPMRVESLFPVTAAPLSEPQLQQAAQEAQQRMATVSAPSAAANTEPGPQRPAIAARAPAGSVRPRIWATADRMWEAAGKPMDKATVLELRKQMMADLEENEGIKRTTSSNELGQWMKDRLA